MKKRCPDPTMQLPSVQPRVHFPTNTECVQYSSERSENKSSSDVGVQTCLDASSDLEELSRDLSKLLEHEVPPDVQLRCRDCVMPAHTSILAARSEVFCAALQNKMREKVDTINMPEVDARSLDLFLKYLYSGKTSDLTEDIAYSLFELSSKYGVPSLVEICCEWIIGAMTEENCLLSLKLADVHNDDDFKNAVIHFIARHLCVLKTQKWYELNQENVRLGNSVYQKCFEVNFLNDRKG